MSASRQALISAGANLGDRLASLCRATARLRQVGGIEDVAATTIYETEPVGVAGQPDYLNLVLAVHTTLSPEALLGTLQAIEAEFGRIRESHWGARTLDLDLLAYEGETRTSAALTLPHPRMLERAFVTVPLAEVLQLPAFQRQCWDPLRAQVSATSPNGRILRRVEGLSVSAAVEALAFLARLKQRGVRPGLERMRDLAGAAGNPHESIPVVHIAGTNGKGSVAAMLEAVLRAAGWRTGLYSSPHLIRFGERIQVDRRPLDFAGLIGLVRELRVVVERRAAAFGDDAQPSYFEFMTVLAFLHFARSRCDVLVIETGMGGLLDATNIVSPLVSVITSIGHDHAAFLGDSLASIAAHKAGIIKPGRPVVVGNLPAEAERVVRDTAAAQGSPVRAIVSEFGTETSGYPSTNLPGDFQRQNAATATLAARTLGPEWRINEAVIAAALSTVVWPGRWQRVVLDGRTVVIDTSHNAEGAGVLEHNLAELRAATGRPPIVVVGVLGMDRAKPLLEVVCGHAEAVYLVIPRQRRACGYAELEACVPASYRGRLERSSIEALFPTARQCLPSEPRDRPVVVTGSIYLAGEILARLDPALGPVEHELQDF